MFGSVSGRRVYMLRLVFRIVMAVIMMNETTNAASPTKSIRIGSQVANGP
jgi:hypothetical protein